MERRQELISNISGLYPADSDYQDTAKIGQQLLMEAIFKNWRELPLDILEDYNRNCNFKEMAQMRETKVKY